MEHSSAHPKKPDPKNLGFTIIWNYLEKSVVSKTDMIRSEQAFSHPQCSGERLEPASERPGPASEGPGPASEKPGPASERPEPAVIMTVTKIIKKPSVRENKAEIGILATFSPFWPINRGWFVVFSWKLRTLLPTLAVLIWQVFTENQSFQCIQNFGPVRRGLPCIDFAQILMQQHLFSICFAVAKIASSYLYSWRNKNENKITCQKAFLQQSVILHKHVHEDPEKGSRGQGVLWLEEFNGIW